MALIGINVLGRLDEMRLHFVHTALWCLSGPKSSFAGFGVQRLCQCRDGARCCRVFCFRSRNSGGCGQDCRQKYAEANSLQQGAGVLQVSGPFPGYRLRFIVLGLKIS
jgi:hypothetical protein